MDISDDLTVLTSITAMSVKFTSRKVLLVDPILAEILTNVLPTLFEFVPCIANTYNLHDASNIRSKLNNIVRFPSKCTCLNYNVS